MIGIRSKKPFYRSTEERLFAFNSVKTALKNDVFTLKNKGGSEELCKRIEESSFEVARINDAVNTVNGDFYYDIIPLKYRDRKSDEYIAEVLNCDPTTVRRNKKRLVERISICLYGAGALKEQMKN